MSSRFAVVLVVLALAGCAQPKGELFPPLDPPLRWPQPPETPRIEYVGAIATEADLAPGRSFGASLEATVFGAPDVRSMLTPYAVCTDGADRVFVADSNAQVVHVFDLETREYERWGAPQGDEPVLGQPLGLAWDPAGRLLVADGARACVQVFDATGGHVGAYGGDLLVRPSGVAVDAARDRIFVADAAAHRVVVLDGAGTVVAQIGERGTDPGRFNFPTNVAVDAAGRLHVADSLNFRVQVFDEDFGAPRIVGGQGDRPGWFSQPKGIALDGAGHLYVVDAHFEAVQVFDGEGRLLLTFGREGHGPGEFWLPAGIHVDSSNRIWIADSYNRRVQVFRYLEATEE